jgi:hypothetical protein
LRRMALDQASDLLRKACILNALKQPFPRGTNRESPAPYQGIVSKFAAGSGKCEVRVYAGGLAYRSTHPIDRVGSSDLL